MYKLETTKQFEKDYKLCKKRGYDLGLIHIVINFLEVDGRLPAKFKAHPLKGSYIGYLECHIQDDWLLVWSKNDDSKEIVLTRTGRHSDLF